MIMRKGKVLIAAVMMAAVGAGFAFAANNEGGSDTAQNSSACSMMDQDKMAGMHKDMLEKKVKDGKLTPEQASMMEETMKDMMKDMKCDMMGNMKISDMGNMMDKKDCDMAGMAEGEHSKHLGVEHTMDSHK